MKQLTEYIKEKLVITKKWKGADKLNNDEIRNIINAHIKQIPKLGYYESIFPNSIKTELSVALSDNGLKDSFDATTENEFNKFADRMKSFGKLMRFSYGSKLKNLDYPIITKIFNEMFDELEEHDFELETMWEDRKTNFIINYYDGGNFLVLNLGVPESSTLFFTQR